MTKNTFRPFVASLAVMLGIASLALGQMGSNFQPTSTAPAAATETKKDFSHVTIENFGQMDERYFRGAQPDPDDYQALKDLGVTTVIDLRNDPTDYEKPNVEALGMKYVNIPMSGWKTPKMESINQFLALLNDPSTGTVYVHCKAGRHRAGVMGAAYRYKVHGWDYDKVYKEMKDFRYSNGLVHGALGGFVKDWGRQLEKEKEEAAEAGEKAAKVVAAGTEN